MRMPWELLGSLPHAPTRRLKVSKYMTPSGISKTEARSHTPGSAATLRRTSLYPACSTLSGTIRILHCVYLQIAHLIKKSFVADVQNLGRLFPPPLGLLQRGLNGFAFGFPGQVLQS